MTAPVITHAPGGGGGNGAGVSLVPFSFIIESPSAADDDDLFIPVPFEATLVEVYHEIVGATSIPFNLVWRAATTPDTGGTNVWSSNKTATTGNSKETSFDNAGSGGADKVLGLNLSAPNGAPQWLRVYGHYTID